MEAGVVPARVKPSKVRELIRRLAGSRPGGAALLMQPGRPAMVTSRPDIAEFHKTLYQILCSREGVATRIKAAEVAIANYSATFTHNLRATSERTIGVPANRMLDRHLANIETQLGTWRELFRASTDIGLVCEGALEAVKSERQKIYSEL